MYLIKLFLCFYKPFLIWNLWKPSLMLLKSSPAYIQINIKIMQNDYMQQVQSRALFPCGLDFRSYRKIENHVSLFTFFFNWTNNSSLEERPQIHSNMDEIIHCVYKRNPFLKTAAKEKSPAGLMVWPAKPINVEMIIKWQHTGGPSIPH